MIVVAMVGSEYNNIHDESGTMMSGEVELSGSVNRHWVGLELIQQAKKSRSVHCRDSLMYSLLQSRCPLDPFYFFLEGAL